MSEAVDRFKEHWWSRAYCAALAGGRESWQAFEYADAYLREFKKRFEKEGDE